MTPGVVRFSSGAVVDVEILSEPDEMARGLMGRTELPESSGALFWFGKSADHPFWMKNTRIPLDLLFLDRERVVGILTLNPFDERLHSIQRNSSLVLEVNGGWAARHQVRVGERVQISMT